MRKFVWLFLIPLLVRADAPELSVRISRQVEHGADEIYSLRCPTSSASCDLAKTRNGVSVGQLSIPRPAAAEMMESFSRLLPQGIPQVMHASGATLLKWEVDTGTRRYEGSLAQSSRPRQGRERFISDAVLSLEGAMAGQFLR